MVCLLTSYEEKLFDNWKASVENLTTKNLERPLLIRERDVKGKAVWWNWRKNIALCHDLERLNPKILSIFKGVHFIRYIKSLTMVYTTYISKFQMGVPDK